MQFFPTGGIEATRTPGTSTARTPDQADAGFAGVLANYIEDGRETYCGMPAGFSAQEKNTGTLSNGETAQFIKALRKRGVDEENLQVLERMLQNGQSITIGTAFRAVTGDGKRLTGEMSDKERDAFKVLLGKMGLSKDRTEDMLTLSDEGRGAQLLQKIKQAFDDMDGPVDATKQELAAMVRALDISDSGMKKIMQLLKGDDSFSLSGQELESLLVEAGREFAARGIHSRHAAQQMRPAMDDALAAAKAEELAGPVSDMRGNRRSEQLKAMMDDTLLTRTGAYDVKRESNGQSEDLSHGAQGAAAGKRKGKNNRTDKTSKLLKNVGFSGDPGVAQEPNAQARNLDIQGRSAEREIFSQVEQGIFQSVKNGTQRLTLQLMPEDLGKLNLVLTMRQGELKALITADNAESAALLSEQMHELKAALEERGIKVAELEVQTGLRDHRFGEQWNDHNEHNEMSDSRERDRIMRLSRIRREEAGMREPAASAHAVTQAAGHGLHVVA